MDLNGNENDIDGTLLLKYLSETARPEEKARVEAWLAEDASNKDTLLQVARIYHAHRTRQRIRQRDAGQALNQLNHRKPFVVSTAEDKMNIQVTGTEFNLQTYENDSLVRIALICFQYFCDEKTI